MIDKECSKCNELKFLTEFGKHKGNKDGLTYYCKECISNRNLKFNKSIAGQWRYRKYDAARKEREFQITQDQYQEIVTNPKGCYLCGDTAVQLGVDRIDNSKGYTVDNIAPCCSPCNTSKGTKTLQEWKRKQNDIYTS